MSTTTTDTTNAVSATEPMVNDLKSFVTIAVDLYKYKFEKFAKVSSNRALTDDAKTTQAAIYLSDISTEIATDYIVTKRGSIDNTLIYNITMLLLGDGRVGKAIALPGSDWDALENLPQFADVPSFAVFLETIKNRDALKREMGRCCW